MEVLLACTPTAGYLDVMKKAFGGYSSKPPTKPPGSLKEEMVWEDEEGNQEEPEDTNLPSSSIQEFDPEQEAAETKGKGTKRAGGGGKALPAKKPKVEPGEGGNEKYPILSKDIKVFFPTGKGTHLHISVDSSLRKRDSAGSDGKTWRYRCLFKEKGEAAGYNLTEADKECDYCCLQLGAMSTHLRKVHLGHAIGCRYCDWRSYRGTNWIDHMKKFHGSKREDEWYVSPDKPQPLQFEITEEVDAEEILQSMFKTEQK